MTRISRVSVLYGGFSSERPVSLDSGKAVGAALDRAGYQVSLIDVTTDLCALIKTLVDSRPDVIFNALHGRFGEDGAVQGLLDVLGIPYTHSGALASAVAMNKPLAKTLFEQANIPVAPHVIASKDAVIAGGLMDRPFVVKPLDEGSSFGVVIMDEGRNSLPFDAQTWPFGDRVMVEKFIPGRELTVGVMGDRALGVTEIVTDHTFYDFQAKYAPGGSRHIVPAPVSQNIAEQAMTLALAAHRVVGCKGVSRTDFRLDGEDLYVLEINTQPGMTGTSLVPEQAATAGLSFEDLVTWMVEDATCPR